MARLTWVLLNKYLVKVHGATKSLVAKLAPHGVSNGDIQCSNPLTSIISTYQKKFMGPHC